MVTVTLHGIPNCDTVKRARAWLAGRGVEVNFHDFKKAGVPSALDDWIARHGWERVVNRQGTAWRKLDEAERSAVADAGTAAALLKRHPSIIKRPVVQWPDGATTVGFDEADWVRRLGA